MPALHPASFIAGKPCSIGDPREVVRQRIRHWRFVPSAHDSPHNTRPDTNPKSQRGPRVARPRWRFGLVSTTLAEARRLVPVFRIVLAVTDVLDHRFQTVF